eukprot:g37543.t1
MLGVDHGVPEGTVSAEHGPGREGAYVSNSGISLEVVEMASDLLDVDVGGMVDFEEGKGGVRDRPGEGDGRVEDGSKIDELFQFQTG